MQLDPYWTLVFAIIVTIAVTIAIMYILYELSKVQYAIADMEKRMLRMEIILEERKT